MRGPTASILLAALPLLSIAAAGGSAPRRDDEASNVPHVAASAQGRCYAKSVPDSLYYSQAGSTRVYAVRAGRDTLLTTYRWFSQGIYLECSVSAGDGQVGTSVVRMGPWPRGDRAAASDLAIAFYRDGALLRRYSTLDLAGAPDRVQRSASHYRVIDSVSGYRWAGEGNHYTFELHTVGGRRLVFDPATGGRVAGR
ncbi:MAG TPA: hypothetical protein VKA84_12080 [Gemmatimonadaceae bacterium]|nr:hypothetical protein [Gemmatimonadaceae bacterium]